MWSWKLIQADSQFSVQLIENHLLFKPHFPSRFVLFFSMPGERGRWEQVPGAKLSYWDGRKIYAYFSKAIAPKLLPVLITQPMTHCVGTSWVTDRPSCPLPLKQHCDYNETDIIVGVTVSMRYNSHIIRFAHFKCANPWFSVFKELLSHHHISLPKNKPCAPYP